MRRLSLLLVLTMFGCRGERSSFATAWNAAVAAKDGHKAWNLLDTASRERIVAGVQRTRTAVAANADLASLVKDADAPVDVNAPPEEVAIGLLTAGLDRMPLTDDGTTNRIHPEGFGWRANVEPVGFVQGGVPITLTLRLADVPVAADKKDGVTARSEEVGQDGLSETWTMKDSKGGDLSKMTEDERDAVLAGKGRLVKDKIVGFTFRPMLEGHTQQEVDQQCDHAAERVAAEGKLWSGADREAARLMKHYVAALISGKIKGTAVSFAVDETGSMVPVFRVFNNAELREHDEPQPRLAFGAWPR